MAERRPKRSPPARDKADEDLGLADDVRKLQETVAELTAEIRRLKTQVEPASRAPAQEPAPRPAERPLRSEPSPRPSRFDARRSPTLPPPPIQYAHASPPAPPPAPTWHPLPEATAKPPRAPRERKPVDLEALIGGNLLAKAGITLLVLGVVFFLKLAFDQGWIGPQARIAMGIIGGIAIAVVGHLLWHKQRVADVYAQVLIAGGVIITYFTVYIAYVLEDYRELLGLTLAGSSLALAGIATLFLLYALWRNAQVLAGVAATLGVVSALAGAAWGVFSIAYGVLLAAAVLAGSALRGWRNAPLVALAAGVIPLFFAMTTDGVPDNVSLLAALLVAAGGLYVANRHGWTETTFASLAAFHIIALRALISGDASTTLFLILVVVFHAAAVHYTSRSSSSLPIHVAVALYALTFVFTVFELNAAPGVSITLLLAGGAGGMLVASARGWSSLGLTFSIGAQVFAVALLGEGGAGSLAVAIAIASPAVLVAAVALWRQDTPSVVGSAFAAYAVLFVTLVADLEPTHRLIAAMIVATVAVFAAARHRAQRAGLAVHVPLGLLVWALDGPMVPSIVAAALFLLLAVPFLLRRDEAGDPDLSGVHAFVGHLGAWLLLALALFDVLDTTTFGLLTAGFALLGFGLAALPFWERAARFGWGLSGLVVAAAWPPIQFDGSATTLAWSALLGAAALMALRMRIWMRLVLSGFGLLVLGHLILFDLTRYAAGQEPVPVSALVAAVATFALLGAWLVVRLPAEPWGGMTTEQAHRATLISGRVFLSLPLIVPVLYLASVLDGVWITLGWAVEATIVVGAGFVARLRDVRVAGLVLFGLAIARLALVDLVGLETVYRVILFIAVGALALIVSYVYARRKRPLPGSQAPVAPRGPEMD